MVCAATVIGRIEPDEVPYPEDAPIAAAGNPNEEAAGGPLHAAADLQTDARYEPLILRASARHGVDAMLVRAVIQVESNYQFRARSVKGAKGLMQLMPATARRYGVANPYDPAANIDAGIRHLRSLLDRFPLTLALAAYNAGEAAVQRFGGVPPYAETRSYVARILRLVGKRGEQDVSS
jgi:soluble lytic murein transglycosylase-like protein